MRKIRERSTYCRFCYARIADYRGASVSCPGCGRLHQRAHEEKHWTLEPRLVKLERLAKAGAFLPVLGLGAWLWVRGSAKPSLGMGQMYAVLLPLVVLFLLWMTASKITRRPSNFIAGTIWAILLPLFGVALAYLGAEAWSAEEGSRLVAGSLYVAAAPALLLGPFCYKTTRWHRDWKTRYLEQRRHDPGR